MNPNRLAVFGAAVMIASVDCADGLEVFRVNGGNVVCALGEGRSTKFLEKQFALRRVVKWVIPREQLRLLSANTLDNRRKCGIITC
jgi:hypothetical protein